MAFTDAASVSTATPRAPLRRRRSGCGAIAAESYVERLKWDVIEAQRRSQNRLLISPFGRTKQVQAVKTSQRQRVVPVGRPPTNHRQGPAAKEMHEIGPASTGGGMAGDVCLT